jgi:hypothetical protein
MSKIGLARAYASDHDKIDSVASYQKFLGLWGEADPSQRPMVEAEAKAK